MKRWQVLFAWCMLCLSALAQPYTTRSLHPNIKSVQIENPGRNPLYPIIELGSAEKVVLRFDDLGSDITTYSYEIIHCDANWMPSKIHKTQYLTGWDGGVIQDYATSINTYFPYTHFDLIFPNDDVSCTVSGNYVICVYPNQDNEHPVLTACFRVVETLVGIDCVVTPETEIDYKKTHQQVNLEISYDKYRISNPEQELTIIVQQNQRTDNQAVLTQPTFFRGSRLSYKMNPQLIFDAGNEYREFDISSIYVLHRKVDKIDYFKPYYHATLFPDASWKGRPYEYWEDVGGRYIINLQNSVESPAIEADYFFTHFSLPMEYPYLDGKVYIMGELTGNRLDEEAEMHYNFETNAYEKVMLLKQGGYDYQIVYVPNGSTKASMQEIEGNYWETGNEYIVYVYHHPFGALYDRLIGCQVRFANFIGL